MQYSETYDGLSLISLLLKEEDRHIHDDFIVSLPFRGQAKYDSLTQNELSSVAAILAEA